MCSKSCTCSAHSWAKSKVSLHDILFSDRGGAHEMWTVLCWDWTIIIRLHAYKHVQSTPDKVTSSSCDLHLWLKMQAPQIFVGMPQKHIGMNHSCEKTTVGSDCTWTVIKVWNPYFFFHIGQFTAKRKRCKRFFADVFLLFDDMFHQA